MVRDDQLLSDLAIVHGALGPDVKSTKYVGAVTVEWIRQQLAARGIPVSNRDCFIKGLASELDLVVPKAQAIPQYGLLFSPQDVVAVLEVKAKGSMGEKGNLAVKGIFDKIRTLNPLVHCAYLTVTERKTYKWAVTEKDLGWPVYILSWHYGSGDSNDPREWTGAWEKLLDDLRRWTLSA